MGFATDISGLIKVWSLRHDRSIWDPPYRHMITSQGEWLVQNRTGDLPTGDIHGQDAIYQPLVILSDSPDRDGGVAPGLYRPESEINNFVIVGREDSTGIQLYTDDRTNNVKIEVVSKAFESAPIGRIYPVPLTDFFMLLVRVENKNGTRTYKIIKK